MGKVKFFNILYMFKSTYTKITSKVIGNLKL